MNLRETLNLPDADFTIPMKADLAIREPQMQKRWEEESLYDAIQKGRQGAPKFILHDGPPYTNSPVHIGTALNKTLKDFVVRYKTIRGFHCPFVPGFDTHGLPIELAVQKDRGRMEPAKMREACRAHAQKFIDIQTEQFKRFGCLADWHNPYATMHYAYEAAIVRAFGKLAEKGFVYRDLKPTYWSTHLRTALADTELVYEDHVSKSIFVRFPLKQDSSGLFKGLGPIYTIIWTTTPWTIPGNLAVAFHPELEYSLVKSGGAYYLLYFGLAEKVSAHLQLSMDGIEANFLGSELQGLVFSHPIFERDSLAVLADYVTTEDGTGVVHTAPGHGAEDFYTGRKYGLPALCPVDEGGVFTQDAGEFAGMKIGDANETIIERLREVGHLLKAEDYRHSYPYSERDGKPVIYRTTEQWFIDVDHDGLRSKALDSIQQVGWFPPQGQTRITAMVENRPDWCISRQRNWGVGIPILYGKESGEPVIDAAVIERIAQAVEQGGSGAWFELSPEEILPEGYKHPTTGETEFRKETDILDVWFDSGVSHFVVLQQRYGKTWGSLEWPADLYLEGSDQHRGWFNSSLMTGVALNGSAPYRNVLTHGFVVDEKGEKMSKSKGNFIEAIEAANTYGADVIRYWAASVEYTADVPCGQNLLKQMGEGYRRVRNTLRFLLANLFDYEPGHEPAGKLDSWIVEKTDSLAAETCEAFDRFDFSSGLNAVHNFCVRELSSFYLDAIKDCMYCDAKDSPRRRSAQEACMRVLTTLTKLVAPLLPHTAEEVYERIPLKERQPSIFLEILEPQPALAAAASDVDLLLEFRDKLYVELEAWKQGAGVKDTQDVSVKVFGSEQLCGLLRSFGEELPTYLKLSWLECEEGAEERFEFSQSSYLRCERSRLRRPDVEMVGEVPLTKRDRAVLGL